MNEFEQAVYHMRQVQKDYFKTRNYTTLHVSKEAERKVDRMLDDLVQKDGKQLKIQMEE